MKFFTYLFFGGLAFSAACSPDRSISGLVPAEAPDATPATNRSSGPGAVNRSAHQFEALSITGQRVKLSQFRGRKILIVNTATNCAYTPQFAEMEQLWLQYGHRVVVLGFPCNQFGNQNPGNDSITNSHCTNNYGVTFPMFSRVDVTGPTAPPLYQFLTNQASNGYTNQHPTWNFCKYLLDERGVVMGYYPSTVTPMSPTIINAILR